MKENQNDSKSQSNPKGQQQDQSDKSQNNSSRNNPSSEDTGGDEKNKEGTKMPGRETRTPVAGGKSTTQDKSQSGNKGK